MPLAKAHQQILSVEAWVEPGGANGAGFVFAYATDPQGPYTDMFTVSNASHANHEFRLDDSVGDTIYVRARTAGGSADRTQPSRLFLRRINVRGESEASPFATGDDLDKGGYGLGLYGSSHVGYLAAVVQSTSVKGILQLDCLKTDFFHDKAYPTYLYYNPYDSEQVVPMQLGDSARDLYNPVTHDYIAKNVKLNAGLHIPADSAMVVVLAPADAVQTQEGTKLLLNGVVVDYACKGEAPNTRNNQ